MYDAIIFYGPTCTLVLGLAWLTAPWRYWSSRVLVSLIGPVLICFGWFFLPNLPLWFKPLPPGQENWVPWAFIGAGACSLVAIPLSVAATILFTRLRGKRELIPGGPR